MAGAGNDGAPSFFTNEANMAGDGDGGAPSFFTNEANMAGAGDGGALASSFINDMDPLMTGGSSSGGAPTGNTAGTEDDGMSFLTFGDSDEDMAEAACEDFDALVLQPPVLPEGNVVTGETGQVEMTVAVEVDAQLAPAPVEDGNVVTRKMGAERMEVAGVVDPAASGSSSKKQRVPTGSEETTGDEEDDDGEQVLEEVPRRTWTKVRDESWWMEVSSAEFSAEEFKRLFRMSPETFEMVCVELSTAIARTDTPLRQAVPVSKRVAVCLWRLASGDSLRKVGERFGLGSSTCQKITIEICVAINALLMHKFVVWPNDDAQEAIAAEFNARYEIPNIIGAVYNTQISTIAPTKNPMSYYNASHTKRQNKDSYSVSLQAVVDAAGSIIHVCAGRPGAMPDEQVLLLSSVLVEEEKLQADKKWLVGGASYPLTDWMMVPYVGRTLTIVQRMFNEKVDGIRKVAVDAVMRVRARWTLLSKRNEMKLDDFAHVLSACCVLHNICERHGDTLDPELVFDLDEDQMLAARPVQSRAASLLRDHIRGELFLHGPTGNVMPFFRTMHDG